MNFHYVPDGVAACVNDNSFDVCSCVQVHHEMVPPCFTISLDGHERPTSLNDTLSGESARMEEEDYVCHGIECQVMLAIFIRASAQ